MSNLELQPHEIYLLVMSQDLRFQIDESVKRFEQEYGEVKASV